VEKAPDSGGFDRESVAAAGILNVRSTSGVNIALPVRRGPDRFRGSLLSNHRRRW